LKYWTIGIGIGIGVGVCVGIGVGVRVRISVPVHPGLGLVLGSAPDPQAQQKNRLHEHPHKNSQDFRPYTIVISIGAQYQFSLRRKFGPATLDETQFGFVGEFMYPTHPEVTPVIITVL
jgi:hypothetical protein